MTERSQHRFVMWSVSGIIACLLVLIGIAGGVRALGDEAETRAHQFCVLGNEGNEAILDAFDVLIQAAQVYPNPSDTRTPEERQKVIDVFLENLRKKLPYKDCS